MGARWSSWRTTSGADGSRATSWSSTASTVLGAGTAEEGLEEVRRVLPDLLLLDVQLPGIDGIEALQQLRADPSLDGVAAVVVTAYAMRGDEERFLADGFDAYIAKPIDTRAFVPVLLEVLRVRGR